MAHMRLRFTSALALLAAIGLNGCTQFREMARTYMVEEEYDEFERHCVYEQRYNANGSLDFSMDFLNVRIVRPVGGDADYQLVVYKESSSLWLFADQPLQFMVDGELIEFPFVTTRSHVLAASNIQKWGYYSASRERIEQIIAAQTLRSKVFTTEGFYNVDYNSALLNRMREFMGNYAERECRAA